MSASQFGCLTLFVASAILVVTIDGTLSAFALLCLIMVAALALDTM